MLLVLENGFTLFIPIKFPSKETLDTWSSFRILFATELSFIMITLPGVFLLVRSLGNSVRLFHRNLIKIMQTHLIAITVSQISRVVALFYEARIIELPEGSLNTMIVLAVTVRCASMSTLLTMIPAMITERSFASRFISDYEKLPRPWISILINVIAMVLATCYYILAMLACLSTFYLLGMLIISVIIMTLSSVAITMVYRRDVAILRDLNNKTGVSKNIYTLSLKFQVEENVRVTKVIMFLSVGYSLWGSFGTCLFGLAFMIFDATHPLGFLFYVLFNNYFAVSFAIMVWWFLWTVGGLRRLLSIRFKSYCCSFTVSSGRPPVTNETAHPIDVHFIHLNSAWAS